MARLDRKNGPNLKLIPGGKKVGDISKEQRSFNIILLVLIGVLYYLVLTGR